uniref:Transcription factor S-II n=1 Tax=Marseillevirus LCMAC102 TaxID=2506603 RepID=A0A481YTJ4_9VIRU|nr:MAG: transcription factor S-II [Marseillevirus LCMAC102]
MPSRKKVVSKSKVAKLSPERLAIKNALVTKFKSNASEYEKLIFEMCCRLALEYEESTEEIYGKYAYEKVGELLTSEDTNTILNDIKKNVLNWDSCVYKDFHQRQLSDNAQLAEGVRVEKGEFPCRNKDCQSKECYYYQSQDRSSDEGMSTYVVCTKCGTRYRFN